MAIGKVNYKTGHNLEPIASAITSMNQSSTKKDKPVAMAQKIKAISTDATAVEGNVLNGQTFYSGGSKKTGNMPNRGAWTGRIGVNGKIAIPAGYHNGSGYVDQVIPTKGSQTYTPSTINQIIPSGQYLSGEQIIAGDPNLIPENIKVGKIIFGVQGTNLSEDTPSYFFNGTWTDGMGFTAVNTQLADYYGWWSVDSGCIRNIFRHDTIDMKEGLSSRTTKPLDLTPYRYFEIEVDKINYSGNKDNNLTVVALCKEENLEKITKDMIQGTNVGTGVLDARLQYERYYTEYNDRNIFRMNVSKLSGEYYLIIGYRSKYSTIGSSISHYRFGFTN